MATTALRSMVFGTATLLVAATAACGSSPASPAARTQKTKSEIVIGMANSATGPFDGAQTRANEDIGKAWQSWVNNDKGGINGHPVRIIFGDTRNDPATAATVANKMVNSDKVIAEVGGSDAVTTSVWVPVFNRAEIPVIGGEIVEDPVIAANEYLFSLAAPASNAVKIAVDGAKATGAKTMSGVLCAEAPGCLQAAEIMKAHAGEVGVEWKGLTQVRASDPNYTAACLTVRDSGSDYVFLGTAAATSRRVVNDCQKQGVKLAAFGVTFGAFDSTFEPISRAGSPMLGLVEGFPWFGDSPAVEAYRDALAKYWPGDHPKNPVQPTAWAALEMFRTVMANASDNPTADEVYKAMTSVKNEDLGGLLPQKVSFEAGRTSTPLTCLFRIRLVDGQYSDGAPQCLSSGS